MKPSTKAILLVIVIAVVTFGLSPVLWRDNPEGMHPGTGYVPFFIFLSALECLLFGIGVLFVIHGWRLLKKKRHPRSATPAFFALTWFLLSWWPHDNFHRVVGESLPGLLYIEYGFHLTLIIAGVFLARFFMDVLKTESAH